MLHQTGRHAGGFGDAPDRCALESVDRELLERGVTDPGAPRDVLWRPFLAD
jgi:hypothetical protein